MPFDADALVSAMATLIGLLSLACIPAVLLRRKEAASTIAWILTLVFIPVVGIVLFWFLGRDRVRRPVRRKATTNLQVRHRISAVAKLPAGVAFDRIIAGTHPDQRGVMRLATHVGHLDPAGGNDVRFLLGAQDTYDAQLEAIEQAKDHIHLEYYIFWPDKTGRRFLDALVAAARRGVRVRLLYDGFGSRALGRRVLAPLREAGGHVAKFFPLDPIRRAWSINLRNHRKIMVVDGRVGFTGGINIGDQFLPWRDIHLRIEGPAVAHLQTVFVQDWFFVTRFELVDPAFFPEVDAHGESVLQIVQSGPDRTVDAVHRLFFGAIASARERVRITTPYFVPDRALLVALQTAAMRGLDVRLILPSESNHRVTFHAGRAFYDELLGAGVHIHECQEEFVHTKAMTVDGQLATVGSANVDVRSFRLNFELIAVLWDPHVVDGLDAIFEADLTRTKEVSLDQWRKRGLGTRLKEGVGRLCAPLL